MSDFVKKIRTADGDKQIDFQALGNFPAAQPGQVMRVTAVDDNGNPTAWEAVFLSEEFLPLDGGIMNGTLQATKLLFDRSNGAYGDAGIYKNNETGDGAVQIMDRGSNNKVGILTLNGANQKLSFTVGHQNDAGETIVESAGEVYHEGNKPTAEEVGALPLTGGELTGPITITANGGSLTLNDKDSGGGSKLHKNASASSDYGTYLADVAADGTRDVLILRRKAGISEKLQLSVAQDDGTSKAYKLYGEHNPGYTYGTTDLTPGSSPLGTGKLHVVYE